MTNKIDVSIKGFARLIRNTLVFHCFVLFLRDRKKTAMDRFGKRSKPNSQALKME